jgi:biotin transport system substrate-specific component
MQKIKLITIIYIALFVALISFGARLGLPLNSGVPITTQTIFVLLAGLILGVNGATAAVVLWMVLGFFGLPVFAGARGGPSVFMGPTGGYMFGFLLMTTLAGITRRIPLPQKSSSLKRSLLLFALLLPASFSVYLIGVPWLMWRMDFTINQAMMVGFIPFILTDLAKTFIAAFVYTLLFNKRRLNKS